MALVSVIRRTMLSAPMALVAATAGAQGGGQPQQQPYENLKYFSKDLPRDSLLTIMRGFTYALGVNCAYCHVEEPAAQPGGRPRLRPPLDDKVEKQKARFMLTMVDTLNKVTLAALPQRHAGVTVNCVTCHRGSPIPGTIDMVLADALDKFGPDSAVARYRKLRETAMSGRYDFTEGPVNGLARSLSDRGKADAAVALLTMNQEFNPNSAQIDVQFGSVYEKSGDKDKAIAKYQAALQKQPNNPQARARLTALGKPPA